MKDLTWLEDVHWIETYSDNQNSLLPIYRPFLLDVDGERWTVATDGHRLMALKGEQDGHNFPHLPEEDGKLDAALAGLLTKPGTWRKVDPEHFKKFFAFRFDSTGFIGDVRIDRSPFWDHSDSLYWLDRSWVEVTHDGPRDPVRFRGEDWMLVIMPLDPDSDYSPPRLVIGEVVV
jgi:hypothetical protein